MLKEEVDHLIAVHPHVPEFLDALKARNKSRKLVTNAHMKSLSLKMERTQLAGYFDAVICAHDYGLPKEDPRFWERLQARHPFQPQKTLLIDDSQAVLRSALDYGIANLLCIKRPDTQSPAREIVEFDAIHDFSEVLPYLLEP